MANKTLLNLFNVKESEARTVYRLSIFQFLQGIGVAFLYTSSYALFLTKFEINSLSGVYILSAILLIIFALIYERFEHILSLKAHTYLGITFLGVSALFLRLIFPYVNASIIIFFLMAWHRVIYTLANLHFWGISAQIFDVRQSKRLFSLVSSGDIPAKLIGYFAVSALAPVLGTENLLYISSGAFIVSLFLIKDITKIGHEHDESSSSNHHHIPSKTHFDSNLTLIAKINKFLKGYFGNKLIGIVGGIAFCVVITVTLIDYCFLTEIKYKFHSNEEFTAFLGLFFGIGRAIAMVAKILISGRVANNLGTKNSLIIMPLLIILGGITVIAFEFGFHNNILVPLYVFSGLVLMTEIVKNIFQDPIFLTIFQPLSKHTRLKGHNIIKGQIDPIGLLFLGLILLGFKQYNMSIDIALATIFIILVCAVWIFAINQLDKEYVKTLKKAVKSRFIEHSELNFDDPNTISLFKEKLLSNNEIDVAYSIELLSKTSFIWKDELIPLINSNENGIVRVACQLISRKRLLQYYPYLIEAFNKTNSIESKECIIKSLASISNNSTEIENIYQLSISNNLEDACIEGFLWNGDVEPLLISGNKIIQWSKSGDYNLQKAVLEIISESSIQNFTSPILNIFNDGSLKLKKSCLELLGKNNNPSTNEFLISALGNPLLVNQAKKSIVLKGESIMPQLIQYYNTNPENSQKKALMSIWGLIGTNKCLETILSHQDEHSFDFVVDCFYSSKRQLPLNVHLWIQKSIEVYIDRFTEVLYLKSLEESIKLHPNIIKALNGELLFIIKKIFNLISL